MAPNSRFAVAVHVMTVLAHNRGRWVSSPALGRSVRTNPVVIRRLLIRLRRGSSAKTKVREQRVTDQHYAGTR